MASGPMMLSIFNHYFLGVSIMKFEPLSIGFPQLMRALGAIALCFTALFNSTVSAQTSAAVNVAGGTHSACAVAASDTGGVGIADATGAMRHLAAMNVTPNMPHYALVKALSDPFPLQDLYSRLVPSVKNKFAIVKNEKLLKQIAERYIKVQQQNEFSYLIVDILTIPAVGKEGARRSQAFASFIATSLAKFGVQNVRLDHKPLNDAPPPVGKPATKS
jgi:hypothetical protein